MDESKAIELVKQIIAPQNLNAIELETVRGTVRGDSYKSIAIALEPTRRGNKKYTEIYIKEVGQKIWQMLSDRLARRVTKKNLVGVLLSYTDTRSDLKVMNPQQSDWSAAPEPIEFYGREAEITQLEDWIEDGCRVIGILAMEGTGKTALARKVADRVADRFERRIWRSLFNAPTLSTLTSDLMQALEINPTSGNQSSIEGLIADLIDYLSTHRILLILDNLESILQGRVEAGEYRASYSDYGLFFTSLARRDRQSCTILTSREKPRSIGLLEAENERTVRSLPLGGLSLESGAQLIYACGCPTLPPDIWQEVHSHYNGNPLALKMATNAALDLTGGNVLELMPSLRRGEFPFANIRDIIDRQIQRLSPSERQILYWLAIEWEPVTLPQLEANLIPGNDISLPAALQSLSRRSISLLKVGQWITPPVAIECALRRLIEKWTIELSQPEIPTNDRDLQQRYQLLNSHTIVQGSARSYLYEWQRESMLKPLLDRLIPAWESPAKLEQHLRQLLAQWQSLESIPLGYLAGNILNLLLELHPDRRIAHLDCSFLPIWQANLVDANLNQIDFTAASFDRTAFTKSFGGIISIALTPQGDRFATGDAHGKIYLWGLESGRRLVNYTEHLNWVRSIAFSPDGLLMASASDDRTVKVWSVDTGSCLATLRSPSYNLRGVKFTPDGTAITMGCDDGTIRFYTRQSLLDLPRELDLERDCARKITAHSSWVFAIVYNRDGSQFATVSRDGTAKIWDADTGVCLQVLPHQFWVVRCSFSPDGRHLITSGFSGDLCLWEVATGTQIAKIDTEQGWVWSIGYSPDGRSIVTAGEDGTIRFWSDRGLPIYTISAHHDRLWAATFAAGGDILITGGEDRSIKIWDLKRGRCARIINGYGNWIKSISLSPAGDRLISGHCDRSLRVWDLTNFPHLDRTPLHQLEGHHESISRVCYSPDGRYLASSSLDGGICLWRGKDFRLVLEDHIPVAGKIALGFSRDGQKLIAGGGDTQIYMWDTATLTREPSLGRHHQRIHCIATSTHTGIVATGSEDSTIKLWNLDTRTCIQTLVGHPGQVFCNLNFSPDGNYLVSCSVDSTIKLWNTFSWESIAMTTDHQGFVLDAAFAPDSRTLYSASCDRSIRAWDLASLQPMQTYRAHDNWVWDLEIDPQRSLLFSAGEDESIVVWDRDRGLPIHRWCVPKPYAGTNITNAAGLLPGQKANLKILGAIEQ
jgi:WD40 repeat protein